MNCVTEQIFEIKHLKKNSVDFKKNGRPLTSTETLVKLVYVVH